MDELSGILKGLTTEVGCSFEFELALLVQLIPEPAVVGLIFVEDIPRNITAT